MKKSRKPKDDQKACCASTPEELAVAALYSAAADLRYSVPSWLDFSETQIATFVKGEMTVEQALVTLYPEIESRRESLAALRANPAPVLEALEKLAAARKRVSSIYGSPPQKPQNLS